MAGQLIGLVGGLGPGATIHYYDRLARTFAQADARLEFVATHADLGFVLSCVARGAYDDLADYLAIHVARLDAAGAAFAAIAAVTPHIALSQLRRRVETPLVDLVDCVRDELARLPVRRVALFGTRFVVESDLFGRLANYEIVRPAPAEVDFIHECYLKIAETGAVVGSGADVETLRSVAQDLVRERGVDIVVLAGTELSLAFADDDQTFPALDCARVHIQAIAKRALAQ